MSASIIYLTFLTKNEKKGDNPAAISITATLL